MEIKRRQMGMRHEEAVKWLINEVFLLSNIHKIFKYLFLCFKESLYW